MTVSIFEPEKEESVEGKVLDFLKLTPMLTRCLSPCPPNRHRNVKNLKQVKINFKLTYYVTYYVTYYMTYYVLCDILCDDDEQFIS